METINFRPRKILKITLFIFILCPFFCKATSMVCENGDTILTMEVTKRNNIRSIDKFLEQINSNFLVLSPIQYDSTIWKENYSFLENDEFLMLCNMSSTKQNGAIREQLEIFNKLLSERLLFKLLNILDDKTPIDSFKYLIEGINTPITFVLLTEYISNYNFELINPEKSEDIYLKKVNILQDALNSNLAEKYSDYSYTKTAHNPYKGSEVFVLNDLFAYTALMGLNATPNLDKNYTGAGMLEIRTDWFKFRFNIFSIFWPNSRIDLNGDKWLSYQGVICGLDVFTPYIRDSIPLVTNLFNDWDRPFYSYKYLGRSLYRLNLNENLRTSASIKLGVIGSETAVKVQSFLHRDVTVSSITPKGWDSQIANGGRFGFQYEFQFDALLFSRNNGLKRHEGNFNKKVNLFTTGGYNLGHQLTAVNVGIGVCNRDFGQTNGRLFMGNKKNGFVTQLKVRYRYVFYSGPLEGYGYLIPLADEDNQSPIDIYTLEWDEVCRNLLIADLFLGYNLNGVMLYWSSTYHSPEYRINIDNSTIGVGHKKEFQYGENQKIGYYYGVFGAVYKF